MNMMTDTRYLKKQSGSENWYICRRIPKDLIGSYGKKEIWESTETPNLKAARVRRDYRMGQIVEDWESERARLRGETFVTRHDLKMLVYMCGERKSARLVDVGPHWDGATLPPDRQDLLDELEVVDDTARANVAALIERRRGTNKELNLSDDDYKFLLKMVRRYLEDQITAALDTLMGREPSAVTVHETKPIKSESIADDDDESNLGREGKITLLDAIDIWKRSDDWKKVAAGTRTEYTRAYSIMCRIIDEKRYVHTLRNADFERIRDTFRWLPKGLGDRTDPVEAALEFKDDDALPGSNLKCISSDTINKYTSGLRKFFGHLVDFNYLKEDNHSGILKNVKRIKRYTIKTYTPADLEAMFPHGLYAEKDEDWYNWIPKIGLLSGARMNEICQLAPDDVKKINGVWVFDMLTEDEEQTRKASGSRRIVPVHSRLIRAGFIDWFEENGKGHANGRIWREATYTPKHRWSGKFHKGYDRRQDKVVKAVGLMERQGFHGFRHLANQAMMDAGVDAGVHDFVMGWSSDERKVLGSRMKLEYDGRNTDVSVLVDAIETIQPKCKI